MKKAREREQRLRTLRIVEREPLRWVVDAVAVMVEVFEGSITLQVKDGRVSAIDVSRRIGRAQAENTPTSWGIEGAQREAASDEMSGGIREAPENR